LGASELRPLVLARPTAAYAPMGRPALPLERPKNVQSLVLLRIAVYELLYRRALRHALVSKRGVGCGSLPEAYFVPS
jgi:hypothetical protein